MTIERETFKQMAMDTLVEVDRIVAVDEANREARSPTVGPGELPAIPMDHVPQMLAVALVYATLEAADSTRAHTEAMRDWETERLSLLRRDVEVREMASEAMERSAGRLAPLVELVSAVDATLTMWEEDDPDPEVVNVITTRLAQTRAALGGDLPMMDMVEAADCVNCGGTVVFASGVWSHPPQGNWEGGVACRHVEGIATPVGS